ncbi:hypothetical protein QEN19_004395 [Hanseniaspora menglaensis]
MGSYSSETEISTSNNNNIMNRRDSPLNNRRDTFISQNKDRTISVLEHNLTYHVRKTLSRIHTSSVSQKSETESVKFLRMKKSRYLKRLTLIGYVLSLLCCLSAGSVMIISLYSSTWLTVLNYNSFQINLISSAINMGAYLAPPFLGVICDTHGPVTLSLISLLSFVPHYYFMSTMGSVPIDDVKNFGFIVYCCFMIGCGTSSLYFASLISCSKFFTESKILSISMPTTLYGSSSVLFAYVVTHWTKLRFIPKIGNSSAEVFLNLQLVFKYMAIFYFIVIVLNYFAASIVTHLKLEYEEENQETEPLLYSKNTSYSALSDEDDEEVLATDIDEPAEELISDSETKGEVHLKPVALSAKLESFFKNKRTIMLFAIVFLSIGCFETFISNMASISKLYSSEDITYLPQITLSNFSLSSTSIRFFVGIAIDLMTKFFGKNSKRIDIYFMMAFLILGLFTQITMYLSNSYLNILSGLMGISYGGLFTIFPIITLNHYDTNLFAIAYGCFLVAPSAGTPFFSLIFAKIFDKNQCLISWFDFSCINSIFLITSSAFGICLLLSFGIMIFGNEEEKALKIENEEEEEEIIV